MIEVNVTPRTGIEYAKIEREGDFPCSWSTCRLEPWEPPQQEKPIKEDGELF